jgi:hypothetical protein
VLLDSAFLPLLFFLYRHAVFPGHWTRPSNDQGEEEEEGNPHRQKTKQKMWHGPGIKTMSERHGRRPPTEQEPGLARAPLPIAHAHTLWESLYSSHLGFSPWRKGERERDTQDRDSTDGPGTVGLSLLYEIASARPSTIHTHQHYYYPPYYRHNHHHHLGDVKGGRRRVF